MAFVPIKLPAGFYRNGTDLDASGRWRDGSLVRWRDNSLRPIGGWNERIADMFADAPRGMTAWQDLTPTRWIAGGTYNALKVSTPDGTVSDITPADLTDGTLDATVNTGYGGGLYGVGSYGAPREASDNFSEATTWSLDIFGQYLIACSVADGRILEWQLNTGVKAAPVANAPTGCLAAMVTDERSIFALGAGGDPRRIEWCDLEDNTTWVASSSNLAGGQTLQTNGQIMAGIRVQGQSLILTDTDAHSATYVGQPYVYNFERVATACGLVARKAVVSTDAGAFWMGSGGFYRYDGSSVAEIKCDVQDYVFGDINQAQISKSWGVALGGLGEVWFFYPSADSNECNRYVAFDYKDGHWLIGEMSRTAGVERGVFSDPIFANETVYNHETGLNFDGGASFAESGPQSVGAGDRFAVVTSVIPDEINLGDVEVSFKARNYPTEAETVHGPYSAANPTDCRFTARQVRMRVEATTLGNWRVGTMRVETKEGSRR